MTLERGARVLLRDALGAAVKLDDILLQVEHNGRVAFVATRLFLRAGSKAERKPQDLPLGRLPWTPQLTPNKWRTSSNSPAAWRSRFDASPRNASIMHSSSFRAGSGATPWTPCTPRARI